MQGYARDQVILCQDSLWFVVPPYPILAVGIDHPSKDKKLLHTWLTMIYINILETLWANQAISMWVSRMLRVFVMPKMMWDTCTGMWETYDA